MSTNHCERKYFWWFRACAPHLWFMHLPNWHFSLLLSPLQRPGMCTLDNFQCLIFGSLPTSSHESLKHKSTFTFTFTLHTIYEVNGTARYLKRCWPTRDNDAILAALSQHNKDNFSKLTAKNRTKIDLNKSVPKNGTLSLLGNYRRWFPSLVHQNTTRLYPDMLSSPWRYSYLKRTRFRIWIRRKTWSWGMESLPLWYNRKRSTKRRNQWRNNSGTCHQRQQGRLCFSFSVSFPCAIFFSIPYPRTWASPKK